MVLGELNPDVIVDAFSSDIPFGQVETGLSSATFTLGSSGAITAAAASTWGLDVALAAVVGNDHLGRLATALVAGFGVDVRAVMTRDDLDTGLTVVINTPDGDRALLTHPGAMTAMRVDDIPTSLLNSARHVHISSVFLQKSLQHGLPELLATLRAQGTTTSLDSGWDPARDWTQVGDLLEGLDYFFPNEAELRNLNRALDLGADETGPHWLVDAADELSRRGPAVAVKRGGDGALLCADGTVYELRITAERPFDTTGAGDNFDAGFLHGVLTGVHPSLCLARAVAAGTVAVRGRGGTGSIAAITELNALADRLEGKVTRRVLDRSGSRLPGHDGARSGGRRR